jgi:hypothetical protein
MGKLSDILAASNGGNINDLWNSTAAADDFAPLPPGLYVCRLASGELRQTKTGTPEFCLAFKVLEGEHKGRQVWHSLYLTPAALPMAKRDLGKLGVTALKQLEGPLPKGIRCRVQVALRRDDNNVEHNRVRAFEVIGIDPPDVDAFAPLPTNSTGPTSPSGSTNAMGLPPNQASKTEEDCSSSTFDKF